MLTFLYFFLAFSFDVAEEAQNIGIGSYRSVVDVQEIFQLLVVLSAAFQTIHLDLGEDLLLVSTMLELLDGGADLTEVDVDHFSCVADVFGNLTADGQELALLVQLTDRIGQGGCLIVQFTQRGRQGLLGLNGYRLLTLQALDLALNFADLGDVLGDFGFGHTAKTLTGAAFQLLNLTIQTTNRALILALAAADAGLGVVQALLHLGHVVQCVFRHPAGLHCRVQMLVSFARQNDPDFGEDIHGVTPNRIGMKYLLYL